MNTEQEQRIAEPALKALPLRRRLDRGELTQDEYLDRLNAVHRTAAPAAVAEHLHRAEEPLKLTGALEVLAQLRPEEKLPCVPEKESAPAQDPTLIQMSTPLAVARPEAVHERCLRMKCPRCAADIGIEDRMTQLQCSDCGAEILVSRKDCTIALRLATPEPVEQDAAPAPTPPANVEEELKKLRAEAAMVGNVKRSAGILGSLCAAAFVYLGVSDMKADHVAIGATVFVCGSALFGTLFCITRHTTRVGTNLAARIREITVKEQARSY